MKFRILAGCAALAFAAATPAQNLVITNGRIIDGTGNVIDRGSVVVQGGKIVSVSSGGAPSGSAGPRIDAHGMTVMAGFIDAHRHFIRGDAAAWLKDKAADNMKSFIDAGFTTVFSMGDNPQGILELRSRLKSGAIMGPALLAAAIVPLARPVPRPADAPPPGPYTDLGRTDPARPPGRATAAPPAIPDDETRAAVRSVKQQGFDAIKTFMIATPGGPESHTCR